MTYKIKVFLISLALIAVFLVFSVFNSFNISGGVVNGVKSSILSAVDNDWDNDGLDNKDESYWNTDPNNPDTDSDGYLDGEEVASGHDPLIPAPNDSLATDDNLTVKMSQLAVAGIYEGSLKPGNPSYGSSLNDLATMIANDAVESFNIDPAKINLQTANSDINSQRVYIEEFSKTFEKLLTTLIGQMTTLEENIINIGFRGFTDEDVVKSFKKSADDYKKVYDDLSKISVPAEWRSNHLNAMRFVGELSQASQAVIVGKNDPIKATVGLNKIVQLWEVLPEITESYSKKIQNSGLNSGSTILK